MVFIETTFAIDTVEGTDLAVGRQQVNAQRDAEAAAMDGAEDRRWIDNCTHNGRKITFFFGVDKINMYLCTRIRKIYVRKIHEKTQKQCWQPSWCADGNVVYQYDDGAGAFRNGRVFRIDIA